MDADLFDSGIGHATQMAWAETNKIGCGVKNCGKDSSMNNMYKVAVVCQYDQALVTIHNCRKSKINFQWKYDGFGYLPVWRHLLVLSIWIKMRGGIWTLPIIFLPNFFCLYNFFRSFFVSSKNFIISTLSFNKYC